MTEDRQTVLRCAAVALSVLLLAAHAVDVETRGRHGSDQEAPQQVKPCREFFDDLFQYGRNWKAMTINERSIWLDGFISGQAHSFLTWSATFSTSKATTEALRQKLFPMYPRDVLQEVMTSLYQDPANTFITDTAMVYIAKAKLSGENIEQALQYSRLHDCSGTSKK